MSSINQKPSTSHNHGGGVSHPCTNDIHTLRRLVLSCMLWEDSFYVDGVEISKAITDLCLSPRLNFVELLTLTHQAKHEYKLRHVPLLMMATIAQRKDAIGSVVGKEIVNVITRADDLTEFLSIYWKDGKKPIKGQVKRGLGIAFTKFDEYQLAKYNRDKAIKLRDVMFLCHPKPKDEEHAQVFKRVASDTLKTPDTWEVRLSSGADKKESFQQLLEQGKLGDLAFLRNLRNMQESGVSFDLIAARFDKFGSRTKVLPFQFVSAARAVPAWEPYLDRAMTSVLSNPEKRLSGMTYVLVDVSGSMTSALSGKSTLNCRDAAGALAILINSLASKIRIFSFSDKLVEVPPRQGMALLDAITCSQPNSCTYLGAALDTLHGNVAPYDRLIVITDEQSHDNPSIEPPARASRYVINVAPNQKGLAYNGRYHLISGFSAYVVQYIQQLEAEYSV